MFKKRLSKLLEVKPAAPYRVIDTRSQAEIIQEVHTTFQTEVDRLLQEANIKRNPTETDLAKKHDRLAALGFYGTTIQAPQGRVPLQDIHKKTSANETLIEAIQYFSQKYPHHKFITEESVKKICDKYGLIYGPVTHFIGEVPDRNLEQIERFKIDDQDRCCGREGRYETDMLGDRRFLVASFHQNYKRDGFWGGGCLPLTIVATPKDFNTKGMLIKGGQLVPVVKDDPIVLQSVYFKGSRHFLVVTAWGAEASDPLVVNEKNN